MAAKVNALGDYLGARREQLRPVGTLIVGRLMTEQRLSDARYPTLAVLMVPPATASIAWFALNDNRITTLSTGLAGVLAMMTLIQLFILPEYLRRTSSLLRNHHAGQSIPVASVNCVSRTCSSAPTSSSSRMRSR